MIDVRAMKNNFKLIIETSAKIVEPAIVANKNMTNSIILISSSLSKCDIICDIATAKNKEINNNVYALYRLNFIDRPLFSIHNYHIK